MSARIDAVDVARGVLESALGKPVSLSMADSYRRPEATVLTCGMPVPGKRYWDGSGTTSLRLTVIVKRINEEEAMADADCTPVTAQVFRMVTEIVQGRNDQMDEKAAHYLPEESHAQTEPDPAASPRAH